MPLTEFQAQIFQLIAANRNPESYVAGGTVINRDDASPRYSKDIDLFHDTQEALANSVEKDSAVLMQAGYQCKFSMEQPLFYRADVIKGTDKIRLEWAADTAFRFLPVVPDELLGYRLHDADAATNKVLAAAGRQVVRDFIDLVQLERTYVSLGVAVWAAAGKDDGLSPEWLINELSRNSKINPATLGGVKFAQPADAVALKQEWLGYLRKAERLMATFPPETMGCLYLNAAGQPARGETFDPSWIPHYGSIKGAWPKIGE